MNVLITGGAGGIALMVAKRISTHNKVYLGIHTDEQLSKAKKDLKLYKNIKPIKLDVTNELEIKKIRRYHIDCV